MGIYLIPMPFFVDGETYLEGKDCTPETFFQRMKAGAEISTSQPAPEEITSLWDTLLKTHDAVLHFPMSSGLSGSCHTAKALAQEYGGRVLVVDDRRISVTLAQSIRNAQVLLAQGKTAAEVRDILEAERDASSVYIAVNTLEYLRKSGRGTAAGAAMAAVLHIKPVLQIQGGKLDAYKKVRGMKAAIKAIIDGLKEDETVRFKGQKLLIRAAYSGDDSVGEMWQAELQKAFPDYKIEKDPLPLSIACHTGADALGVGIMKDIIR